MTRLRVVSFRPVSCSVILVRCDTEGDASCLEVSSSDSYGLSGTAMSTSFTPESKPYTGSRRATPRIREPSPKSRSSTRWFPLD